MLMSSLSTMGSKSITLSTDLYVAHSEMGYYQGKLWCVDVSGAPDRGFLTTCRKCT